jgi:glycosyltransferase involved in cell wall biosynthesis
VGLPEVGEMSSRIRSYARLQPRFVIFHSAPQFDEALQRTILEHDPDVVHVYGLPLAQYIPSILQRRIPVALDVMDSWSLRYRRFAREAGPLAGTAWGVRSLVNARYERWAARLGVTIIASNEADCRALIAAGSPESKTTVVQNGVDAAGYFTPAPSEPATSDLVFVGDMSYAPNADAAELLISSILPRVQSSFPAARAVIVGKNPGSRLVAKAGTAVEVTGFVEDVRPFLHRAAVVVIPLSAGTGIKNKVLEAMAAARPVVMTPVAAEGIAVQDGVHGFVRDETDGLVDAVASVLADRSAAQQLGRAARALVTERYGWKARIDELVDVYERAIKGPGGQEAT